MNLSAKWKEYRDTKKWEFVLRGGWTTQQQAIDRWCHRGLLAPPWVTWEMIKDHPNKSEDFWSNVSLFITPDIVEAHPELPWDMYQLSKNQYFTLDFFLSHPDWKWSQFGLYQNPNLTPTQLLKDPVWNKFHYDKFGTSCQPSCISQNPHTTPQYIQQQSYAVTMTPFMNLTWTEFQELRSPHSHFSDYIGWAPFSVTIDQMLRSKSLYDDPVYVRYMHRTFLSDMMRFFWERVMNEFMTVYFHPDSMKRIQENGHFDL